ncbi:hypothetical protein OROGR_016230 [Orobanche gracilis]
MFVLEYESVEYQCPKLGAVAGLAIYGFGNSFYNIEGGHCAIVSNRVGGIKDKVFFFIYDVRA